MDLNSKIWGTPYAVLKRKLLIFLDIYCPPGTPSILQPCFFAENSEVSDLVPVHRHLSGTRWPPSIFHFCFYFLF